MKKIFRVLLLILVLFLCGCTKVSEEDRFNNYLEELFVFFIGDDPLTINFTLYDPSLYNLENNVVKPITISEEESNNYYLELETIKEELLAFTDLNSKDELTKIILLDYINRQLAFKDLFYYGTVLGSNLGYQAQLPIILAEYRFDDLQDILNYFDYLQTTEQTFSEIIKYEKEKINRNIGLPHKIIIRIIDQCEVFLANEENFLIPTFNEKIDNLSFLDDSKKEELKKQNKALVTNSFLEAYKYLQEELRKLLTNANNSGGLGNFPDGKAYYEALFHQNTGIDVGVETAKLYLEGLIDSLIYDYSKNYYLYATTYSNSDFIGDKIVDDLILHFKESMKNDFPNIDGKINNGINVKVKNIHTSLQEYSAPAMYLLSPIDDNRDEVIYINPLQVNSLNNYTYQTFAHEGYPGHLYQNIYLKNSDLPNVRKILDYPGYMEGWATYIENYVIKYGGGDETTQKVYEFYNSINYLILGLLDIGVNYEGWSLTEAKHFLSNYYELTSDEVESYYYDVIEAPTNYLQYYLGYYYIQDMKIGFEEGMEDDYSDLLFHKIFLETGPAPFSIIEEQYAYYIEQNAN